MGSKNKYSKVAIVTGGNKGVGLAFAEYLLGRGYKVFINYKERIDAVKPLLKQYASSCHLVKADVTKEKEVLKMFQYIAKNHTKIDLLINNVGPYLYKDILDLTPKEFNRIITSSLSSTFICSKLVLPFLSKGAQIINLGYSSCEKITYSRYRTPYNISKTGVFILTKVLANALSCKNIRVNMISPGVVRNSVRKPKDLPFNRPASYSDLTNALGFLIDKKAAYISGCNLEVSGGYLPLDSV